MGLIDLDEPAGPPGCHGPPPAGARVGPAVRGRGGPRPPGTRRIYSNPGFDQLGALLAERDGIVIRAGPARARARAARHDRTRTWSAAPSEGLHGTARRPRRPRRELLRPHARPAAATRRPATAVAFPGLTGVLPGVGRFDPLDWGLGFELRDAKVPHWTGTRNSPRTFGHFGGIGHVPVGRPRCSDRALVCLTDRDYGPWALEAWPRFSDAVIAALAG